MTLLQFNSFTDPSIVFLTIIFSLALLVVIFLIIRGIVLWYYKIPERLREQKQTNAYLKELIRLYKQANNIPEEEKPQKPEEKTTSH